MSWNIENKKRGRVKELEEPFVAISSPKKESTNAHEEKELTNLRKSLRLTRPLLKFTRAVKFAEEKKRFPNA